MIALGMLATMWILSSDAKRKNIDSEKTTDIGVWALVGFAVIRSIVELFRGNPRILGIISVSYLLSLSLILAGLLWMKAASKRYETRIKSKLKCFSFQMETLVLIVVLITSTAIFYVVQLSL